MAIVQETRVKAGYENIHAMATAKLGGLEEEAKKKVEELIGKDKKALDGIIAECIEVVDVEVPDEVEAETEADDCAEVQPENVEY